jgi:hypothetical protein
MTDDFNRKLIEVVKTLMALAKTRKKLKAISINSLMASAHARENQDYFP